MTQYGQSVMYLSDFVRKFNLKQGNVKGVHFIRTMEFASWAWKELFRTSIWEIKTVVLHVDRESHTITIPEDCETMVNISVVDRFNQIQTLTHNPNINTAKTLCVQNNKCSCQNCHGVDSLCEAMDNITTITEDVEINGEVYQKTIWTRSSGCTIQKEERVPVWDADTEVVVYITNNQWLCDIEVDDKGCIKPTKPNIAALQNYCGYNGSLVNNGYRLGGNVPGSGNPFRPLMPAPYNFYGQWNWDASSRSIIHIFRSRRQNCVYVNSQQQCNADCGQEENDIHQVILSYQTIGATPGQEILIPEYAEMAMSRGVLFQQSLFNPRDKDRNGSMEQSFKRGKMDLDKHLNPISMADIRKIQTQARPW